jgi:signal transduction histidine kinase/CheY-like chemotaxis protein
VTKIPAIVGVVALVAALILVLMTRVRDRRKIAELRRILKAAADTQRLQISLLSQRASLDTIKDEFISTVSHELRTPLTSIRGALGLLSAGLMGSVDPKAANLLRIAVTNTDRLIRLINDILDLERMESGRAPLQIRRCSLPELAQQGIETMTALGDAAQVRIKLIAGDPDPILFDGDPDRIVQIVTNLLSNAIKFSPPNSTVYVHISANTEFVVLRVEDEGRGIPVDQLEAIFDRFQQVEVSDARQKGGTGLGLAICRTIVQQHNGSIWAQPNPSGHGTSLCLELPRRNRAFSQVDESGALAATAPSGEGTIIVCDDDAGIRAITAEHLRRHGYDVLEADRGERAIELASNHRVEAILLDLYMPGLSGWETLRQLKNSPHSADIPVVILSVLSPIGPAPTSQITPGAPVDRPRLIAAAQGWIQKPFNENLLLAELSRVLHTGDGPAHLLLVEDDDDLAAVIISGFEDANVRIDHANTRHKAIERCLIARPDLLILDLGLPDGDGFSLVDWLRRQPDLRSLPLVVYSGREVSDSEMSKLRLGPTQFLTKAKVQPREVEELVLTIVNRIRKANEAAPTNSTTTAG